MMQLKLQLTGFDADKVIAYFEDKNNKLQYRWVPGEIAAVIQRITPNDQAFIDYFKNSKEYLFYLDEIVPEIKKFLEKWA